MEYSFIDENVVMGNNEIIKISINDEIMEENVSVQTKTRNEKEEEMKKKKLKLHTQIKS
jgi:hypothetical protein